MSHATPGRRLLTSANWSAVRRKFPLSDREFEILQLIFDDRPKHCIATELQISHHTVHTYFKRLFAKLGARSRVEAVCIAVECAMQSTTLHVAEHRLPAHSGCDPVAQSCDFPTPNGATRFG
ncbi:MAG: helix-turn-helix transcriptional regulator [Planctomycetales bacterium]|nr:helix-turn-helix transcriptional regulator [Planctomycetales bacterium]